MNTVTEPLILRVITRLGAGRLPIHVITTTREMAMAGFRTVLVTGSIASQDSDMSYLLDSGDPIIRIPEMSRDIRVLGDMRALWKLYRLMRELRPDIVHTHTAKAGLLGRLAAKAAGVPAVVHTFHGNVLSGYFSAPVNACVRLAERALARITDGICVLSSQQAEEIVNRYRVAGREKIRIVPLGMDLRPFGKIAPADPAEGTLTVGWMGRFVSIKDVPLLVAAAEHALRRNNRIRFVIAGDGPDRHLIEAAEKQLGPAFRWVGWRKDVQSVLAECDVLLQTSRNEGTPVALIQGMSAGRPFVSTAAGGVADMVQSPAVRTAPGARWFGNAVLTDPSADVIAGVLAELAAHPDLVRRMGRTAQTYAASQYTVDSLVSRLEGLYRSLLGRGHHAADPVAAGLSEQDDLCRLSAAVQRGKVSPSHDDPPRVSQIAPNLT
jgi:glycosyltransferase involved in cell wall biosynthesis